MKMKSRGILCFATLLAAFSASAAQQGTLVTKGASQSGASKKAAANYAKLPGTFEGNVGQTDPQVKFLSRGSGYVVFLTAGGMVFPARSQFVAKDGPQTNSQQTLDQKQNGAVIQLNLVGANINPAAIGEDQQCGKKRFSNSERRISCAS
jgi:hypothetical protein